MEKPIYINQDAINNLLSAGLNRFQWYNLPLDISSQELERLLYYRGQLCINKGDRL